VAQEHKGSSEGPKKPEVGVIEQVSVIFFFLIDAKSNFADVVVPSKPNTVTIRVRQKPPWWTIHHFKESFLS
jgi:hypothetical protein